MSAYIKLSTLEFPRHEGDIRLEHPEILDSQTGNTFPCPETYALVTYDTWPEVDLSINKLVPSAPEKIGESWRVTWAVVPYTEEELLELAEISRSRSQNFMTFDDPGSVPDVIG